jgi:hypothetical protein
LAKRPIGILIIYMSNLGINFGNEAGFEAWIRHFGVLDLESEFGSDEFMVLRTTDNGICTTTMDESELFFYSGCPVSGVG